MISGERNPIKVIVVGGGTAGWLTAATLNRVLGAQVHITVIESADIPTIGVGEATIPTLKKTLHDLDVEEEDFLTNCDATFKHGILFRGWRTGEAEDRYYHTFEQFAGETTKFSDILEGGIALTGQSTPDLGAAWLDSSLRQYPPSYAYHVGVQPVLCDRMLSPKDGSIGSYQGLVPYAYHLDAAQFGEFLAAVAVSRGVERHFGEVIGWTFATGNDLESVRLADGTVVAGDVFVDCTGFRALLIGQALGVPFVPYEEHLLCDRAVVAQFDHDETATRRPFTTSSAATAGWIWEIDTYSRQGTGYVYSSAFSTDEEAVDELSKRHRRNLSSSRVIKFKSGRRRESWHGNVVAIGLSSGFLEPLESTGIFLIERASSLLATCLPTWGDSRIENTFNAKMTFLYEEIRDFLVMHYHVSKRDSSTFWQEVRRANRVPDTVAEKLDEWSHRAPAFFDTDEKWRCFTWASYRSVLWGMGHLPSSAVGGDSPPDTRLLVMPWAADRISDRAQSHHDALAACRIAHSGVPPEQYRLHLNVPHHTVLTICSGTRLPTAGEKQALELEHSAVVPEGDWRTATASEEQAWFSQEGTKPGRTLSVVELPDELRDAFLQIGKDIRASNETLSRSNSPRRAVVNLLADVVRIFGDPTKATRPLGIGHNPPSLAVTTRGSSGKRIGLHVDNWMQGESLDRQDSDNRLCINLGSEPRYLLFLPIPISTAAVQLGIAFTRGLHLGPTDVARIYMRRFPETPVFRVEIKPGEAYIAPTENIVHDGCTLGRTQDDLFVTYLGRFGADRLDGTIRQ